MSLGSTVTVQSFFAVHGGVLHPVLLCPSRFLELAVYAGEVDFRIRGIAGDGKAGGANGREVLAPAGYAPIVGADFYGEVGAVPVAVVGQRRE